MYISFLTFGCCEVSFCELTMAEEDIENIKQLLSKELYAEVAAFCVEQKNGELWRTILGEKRNDYYKNLNDINRDKIIDETTKILTNCSEPDKVSSTVKAFMAQDSNITLQIKLIDLLAECLFGDNSFEFKDNRNLGNLISLWSIKYTPDRVEKYLNLLDSLDFVDLGKIALSPQYNLIKEGCLCYEKGKAYNELMTVIINDIRDLSLAKQYIDKYGKTNHEMMNEYNKYKDSLIKWDKWKKEIYDNKSYLQNKNIKIFENLVDDQSKLILNGFIRCIEKQFDNDDIIIPSSIIHLCLLYFFCGEYFTKPGYGLILSQDLKTISMSKEFDPFYKTSATYGNIQIDSMVLYNIYKWKFKLNLNHSGVSKINIGISDCDCKHYDPFQHKSEQYSAKIYYEQYTMGNNTNGNEEIEMTLDLNRLLCKWHKSSGHLREVGVEREKGLFYKLCIVIMTDVNIKDNQDSITLLSFDKCSIS